MSKKIRENATVKAKTAANRDNLTRFSTDFVIRQKQKLASLAFKYEFRF